MVEGSGLMGSFRMENARSWDRGSLRVKNLLTVETGKYK